MIEALQPNQSIYFSLDIRTSECVIMNESEGIF
jgi:hypothetical protein